MYDNLHLHWSIGYSIKLLQYIVIVVWACLPFAVSFAKLAMGGGGGSIQYSVCKESGRIGLCALPSRDSMTSSTGGEFNSFLALYWIQWMPDYF